MAKKFLSREEYLDKQRQAIIEQSLENSRNRTLPAVPLVLKESETEWKEKINKLIEVVKSELNDAIQYNHGKDKVDSWQNELNRLNDKLNKGYTEELCAGDSCIYTATDNFGKKYRISGNQSFRANPSKYGFVEIGLNEIAPGDIIQDFSLRDNIPHHAITFIGYDNDNKALFNYSSGGQDESSIKKNVHYPFTLSYEEPIIHLNGTNNDKLRNAAAAYRFIGPADDNKVWNENYNKERSDWSRQIVEELRKVPTLTLPNQVQMMKFGGMKQDKVFKLKGGVAIPLDDKKRLFYLSGAKHEQGGIDVTPELEAEGGEVVKINPKSIKVVTAQKIMGGKSPAELVVDAASTGKSEKVFNKVFNYQEDFKDRYNLNDDGTKKAKWGIIEKIKNSKVGKQILNHLKFETFFDNKTYDSNIMPMDDKIANGEYALYPIAEHSSYNKGQFYKKDNEIVYDNNFDYDRQPGYMQYKGYEPLNYDELRKMLPKRDYIGGSKRDVGIKVINKVPGLKNEILRLSELYGISPNVFTQRLINEGWVLNKAASYNRSSVTEQKNYNWDKMNNPVDGFIELGLDTFGDHHKAGHLNLRRDIKYSDRFTTNEDNTGRLYNSANFDNMYDALEAKAAMIEYLTKLGKEKGHSGSDLDAWVNAAYNMGEYHKDLNNMNYVRRKYSIKPYYKYGGEMKNKKKANLGIEETFNKFGQHFYPAITPSINTSTIDNDTRSSFGEQLHPKTNMVEPAAEIIDDNALYFTAPYWNYSHNKINLNRTDAPYPYRPMDLEQINSIISPKLKVEDKSSIIPVKRNINTFTNTTNKTPVVQRTTPNTTTTNKTTVPDINQNVTKSSQTPSQTNSDNISKSFLNLDFLNELTNPNGSTYNLRTGQTYFKDWNKVRKTPYSSLNLKTGETEYAGFINPYGSKLQSAVYNNGPQGRQERTTKERLLNTGDWINIGSNALGAVGNLLTGLLTPDIKYARMRDSIPLIAPKINSNVNTTAEEDAIDEAYNDEIRAIDENTADSKTALNRKRNAALKNRQAKVKVRSAAENTRRDLINKGNILAGEYQKYNIGRQEQVDAYNAQAKAAEFNANRTKVSDAITGFLSDLTGSASTITNAIERRQADRKNTVLSYLANPNVDPTKFKEGYDKVYAELYPSKTKTKNKSKKNNTQP